MNFIIGGYLRKNSQSGIWRKQIFITGLLFNLGLLGYFKYVDFFILNLNAVINSNFNLLYVALPLAISFFTFQQIAFLVDCYRREAKEYDFLNYTIFVTFFPQLVSGPIVHHKEMMPQFASVRRLIRNYENILIGLFLITVGLIKKLYVADLLAPTVSIVYDGSGDFNIMQAWISTLSYTLQIYFDFSGYTDMALGSALLFNIKLPVNFNSPYKAVNIQDFWQRWHITLSRFFRSHLYIPFGGNRGGVFFTSKNLLLVFLIGGLWHGAHWTFVFWGFLHGMAMVLHRLFVHFGFKMNRLFGWLLTFIFLNFSWVFFRAGSFTEAKKIILTMVDISGLGSSLADLNYSDLSIVASLSFLLVFVLYLRNSNEISALFYKTKIFKF